jgi:metal-responsive CopG/Arc/MetJ family transcriptional regulator
MCKIASLLMDLLMENNMFPEFKTVRTTVTLPTDLINRSQHFIDGGTVPSRNALIVAAVERFLSELERQEIDRQFEAMAEDEEYQAMNQQLSEEFADSDWEALTEGEGE